MALHFANLNYPAILMSAIIYVLLGMLWYSPFIFGNVWLKLSGSNLEEKTGLLSRMFAIGFLAVIIALSLALMIEATGIKSFYGGAKFGLICGIGIAAVTTLITNIFEERSFLLFLINGGYHVIAITHTAAFIAVWK